LVENCNVLRSENGTVEHVDLVEMARRRLAQG
jgi:hypothetical protein